MNTTCRGLPILLDITRFYFLYNKWMRLRKYTYSAMSELWSKTLKVLSTYKKNPEMAEHKKGKNNERLMTHLFRMHIRQELTEEGLPFLILFHHPDDTETPAKFTKQISLELLPEKSKMIHLLQNHPCPRQ